MKMPVKNVKKFVVSRPETKKSKADRDGGNPTFRLSSVGDRKVKSPKSVKPRSSNGLKKQEPQAKSAPSGFMARLKDRARRPTQSTRNLTKLAIRGEALQYEEEGLSSRTILVSKALYNDLVTLSKLLKRFGKTERKIAQKDGFTKLVKSFVYTRQHAQLVKQITNHCLNMGIRLPPFRGYENFIRMVASRVPEIQLVNNNIFNIIYNNSFNFNIFSVAAYDQTYSLERDLVVDQRVSKIDNKFYSNKLILKNRFTLMMIKQNLDKKVMLPNKSKVTLTAKKGKSNATKFDVQNLKDFPNLERDCTTKLKQVKKLSKHLSIIPRIVVTPPQEERDAWLQALRTKRAEKRRAREGPTEEELLRPQPSAPVEENITLPELRMTNMMRRIYVKNHCWFCCLKHYRGRLPRVQVRELYRSHPFCSCNVEQQGLGDTLRAGFFSKVAPDWAEEALRHLQKPETEGNLQAIMAILNSPAAKQLTDAGNFGELVKSWDDAKILPDDKIKQIKEIMDTCNKISQNARDAMETARMASSSIYLATRNVEEIINKECVESKFFKILSKMIGILLSIPIYSMLNFKGRTLLFCSQIFTLNIPLTLMSCFKSAFKSLLCCYVTPRQQSDAMDFTKMIGPISQMISVGMVSATASCEKDTVKHLVQMGNLTRSFQNVKSFSEAVQVGVEESSKQIFSLVTGLPPEIQTIAGAIEGLESWITLISETIENPEWMATYLQDPANDELLSGLIETGVILQSRILKPSSTPVSEANQLYKYVSTTLSTLRKYSTTLKAARSGSKDRILPVSVLFCGPPGIGKTHTCNQLVVDLMAKQDESYRKQFKTIEEMKFTKAPTTDYYDGYLNHFVYVQDEIFQSTLPDRMDADCKQIMGLIQESSSPLDMARLEGKGNVYFQSRYVMFTTNKTNILSKLPVVSGAAIRRRMHNIILMEIAQEFKTGERLNHDLWVQYAQDRGFNPAQPNYARFHVRDVHGQVQVFTYKGLVEHLHSQHLKNKEYFESTQRSQREAIRTVSELDEVTGLNFRGSSGQWPVQQSDEVKCCLLAPHSEDGVHECQALKIVIGEYQKSFSYLKGAHNFPELKGSCCCDEGCTAMSRYTCVMTKLNELNRFRNKHDPLNDLKEGETYVGKFTSRISSLRETLTKSKVTPLVETAKVRMGIEEDHTWGDKEKVEAYSKKYGISSEETLLSAYYLYLTYGYKKAPEKILKTLNIDLKEVSKEEWKDLGTAIGHPHTNRFKMVLRSFVKKVKSHPYLALLTFLTGAGLLVGGIMAMSKWKTEKDLTEEEAAIYGANKDKGSRRTFALRQGAIEETTFNGFQLNSEIVNASQELFEAEEQAAVDSNWESQMAKVIGNLLSISYADNLGMSDNCVKVRGIAVDNDYAIMPVHGVKGQGYLKVNRGGISFTVAVKDLKFIEIGERWGFNDVMIVKFPQNKLGGVRPILNLICSQSEIANYSDGYGELMVVDPDKKIVTRHASRIETDIKIPVGIATADGSAKYLTQGYRYNAATQGGDCGSPLIRWDPKSQGKIMGIHAAGARDGCGTAYACIIDREWIRQSMKELGTPVSIREGDESPLYGGADDITETMDIVGYTPERARLPLGESVFVPSEFAKYKFKEFSTAPAVRTASGPDSSLALVLKKYKKTAPYVDRSLVKKITTVIALEMNDPRASREIFDYERALNVLDTVRSVDLSTSMGYPWSLKQKKKSDYVGYDDKSQKFYFLSDEIPKRCLDNEQRIKQLDGRDFVFINCLKDERLPLEAVARKKVRLFMICPFDLTLMVRKFFGAFIERIHQLKFVLGVCVGIDPHSSDWDTLARRLTQYNDLIYEIDYSNWDRSIPMEFLSVFFDLADLFYQDEHKNVRRYIRAAILNPTYQLKYFRYKVLSGNPSGCPVTTELNSIANLAMTMYVICQLGYAPTTVFQNTFVATYGDDSALSTALPITDEQLKEGLAALGMIATSAKKDEPVQRRPINEVQFLKRNFIFYDGKFYAPLLMDTIMESMMWVRRGNNQRFNFTQTVENALVELQQYPPKEVTQEYLKIFEFARRCDFRVSVSDHCILSLEPDSTMEEGAIFENTFIKIALAMYRIFFKVPKYKLEHSDPIFQLDKMSVKYVGFDIASRGVGIKLGYFYHVGFRHDDWEMELTFSDRGPVWIPKEYSPDFEYDVTITRNSLRRGMLVGPYHLVRNNCIDWCEEILRQSGSFSSLPEWAQGIGARLKRKTLAENSFLWAQEQGDDITETNIQPLNIQFHEGQQVTSGQEIRTIDELLSTDTKLAEEKWDGNHAYDHTLVKVAMPGKLQVVKQFECKLKYTALLRADLRFRVEISALKMYAGSLIAYWVPCTNRGYPKGMKVTAKQASGMEHVQIILPNTPVAEITVPYTHYKNFISQTSYAADELGTLYIKVVNTLSAPPSGDPAVLVQVFGNFVNVQAIITTPLSTQSKWKGEENVYPKFAERQGDEAEDKSSEGIISGPSTSVARIADVVSGIPIFSGVASSVSVMARSVATIATYLGLSKPRNLQATMPVIPRPFSNVGFADALDGGTVLGIQPKNSVVIQPSLFGKREDQLSINYLIRKPCIVLITSWSKTMETGKTLYRIPVHPCVASPHTDKTGGWNPLQMSYLGYVGSLFNYWRGTIRFRFEIIATDYHAGSLIIGFIPRGTIDGDKDFPYETTLKEIVAIEGYTVAEIEVPFISTAMVNYIGNPYEVINLASNYATGTLVVKVQKPLLTSGVVGDDVEINIWVSAGEDFEFHYPHLDNVMSFSYTGKEDLSEGFNIKPTVGRRTDLVMGEDIHSCREILKISTLKYSTSRAFRAGVSEVVFPAHTFTGEDSANEVHDTYYTHLMRLYRFSRGSIRHKLMFGSMEAKVSAIASLVNKQEYEWVHTRTLEGAPWTTTHGKINPTLEYEIPFYNIYKMEVHGDESSIRGAVVQFEKLNEDVEHSHICLYESIGDDFSAGYMMGPPVVYQKRTALYKLLYAVANADMPAAYVDDYYDFTTSSRHNIKIKSRDGMTIVTDKVPQQYFYYTSYMKRYVVYVADAELQLIRDFLPGTLSNNGFTFSKAVCFVRRDKASITKSGFSYDNAETPLNGVWFGIHASTAGLRFYLATIKETGLRNVKVRLLKSDLLTEVLGPLKRFIGHVEVNYE